MYIKCDPGYYVGTYGLHAIMRDTKEPTIANFFMRPCSKVYQAYDIIKVFKLIDLVKRQFKYNQFEEQLWKKKAEQRKKLIELIQKQKKSVKLLTA